MISDYGFSPRNVHLCRLKVAFLGHIVGRTGLACDPETLAAVRNWHEPIRFTGSAPITSPYSILLPVCEKFCGIGGPVGGSHAEQELRQHWADEQADGI